MTMLASCDDFEDALFSTTAFSCAMIGFSETAESCARTQPIPVQRIHLRTRRTMLSGPLPRPPPSNTGTAQSFDTHRMRRSRQRILDRLENDEPARPFPGTKHRHLVLSQHICRYGSDPDTVSSAFHLITHPSLRERIDSRTKSSLHLIDPLTLGSIIKYSFVTEKPLQEKQ